MSGFERTSIAQHLVCKRSATLAQRSLFGQSCSSAYKRGLTQLQTSFTFLFSLFFHHFFHQSPLRV